VITKLLEEIIREAEIPLEATAPSRGSGALGYRGKRRRVSVRKFSMGLLQLVATTILAASVPAGAAAEPASARSVDDPGLSWGPCPDLFPTGCEIAVLHGDPAKPNADVFFRVPAGYELPKHWHGSAERMILVSGELTVVYEGQAPVVLSPGTYAYGPPRAAHHGRCASSQPCTLFIAFEGPVDATAGTPPDAR
jgi:quercetin dioxygenase-like cupin family protein